MWHPPPLEYRAAASTCLRFYLEDYTQLPVGEYLVRGERVEKEQLARRGEALYAAAFADDEKRHAADIRARAAIEDSKPVEVAIRSNDPRFPGLPWELLKARFSLAEAMNLLKGLGVILE